jgi:hypothetical protein
MIDGRTQGDAWSIQLDPETFVFPVWSDLDGDGKTDIQTSGDDVSSNTCSDGMLSGASGIQRWSLSTCWFWPVVGSFDGAPGSDVLAIDFPSTDTTSSVVVRRIDGASGATLSQTVRTYTLSPDDEWTSIGAGPSGDVDGDGSGDVLSDFEAGTGGGIRASESHLESGTTGSPLYDTSESEGVFGELIDIGDTDGDGRNDIMQFEDYSTADGRKVSVVVLGFPGAIAAWSRSWSLFPSGGMGLWSWPDMAGDGGTDLILNRGQRTLEGTLETRFDLLSGRTGSATWGVGDDMTEPAVGPPSPPPPGEGHVQGQLWDDGYANPPGICVDAFGPDGTTLVGSATTDQDGRYEMPLPAGDYKLRFSDCTRNIYATQWYKGEPDAASANTVDIASNQYTYADATLAFSPDLHEQRRVSKTYTLGSGDGQDFLGSPIAVADCDASDGVAGACFRLGDEPVVSVSLRNAPSPAYAWTFYDGSGAALGHGDSCGNDVERVVPDGATTLEVMPAMVGSALCGTLPPTTGTIDVAFLSPLPART